MKTFQIIRNEVLIIDDKKEYCDTLDNWCADSGVSTIMPQMVIYNTDEQHCVIDGVYCDYPNPEYNGYIADIDAYIAAKEQREYVPLTLAELQAQAIAQAYAAYQAEKYAPVWVGDIGFLTTDEGQQNWQTGIALLTDGQTELQVLIDKNDLTKKEIRTVTQADMLEAGKAARASQYAAYEKFQALKEKIKLCDTVAAVQVYITEEPA